MAYVILIFKQVLEHWRTRKKPSLFKNVYGRFSFHQPLSASEVLNYQYNQLLISIIHLIYTHRYHTCDISQFRSTDPEVVDIVARTDEQLLELLEQSQKPKKPKQNQTKTLQKSSNSNEK